MVNESHLIPTHDDSHWWEFVVRQGRACSVRSVRQSRIIVTGRRSVRYARPFPSNFSYNASSGSVKQS